MYLLASSTITVGCPRAAAFDYAADLENYGDWFPGVTRMVAHDDLQFATVGKQYVETIVEPLRGQRKVSVRVVDTDGSRFIATEGDLPLLLPRMQIDFTDVGPHTCEVRWRMYSRNDGVVARYTLLPLAARVMGKRAVVGLERLKSRLEA